MLVKKITDNSYKDFLLKHHYIKQLRGVNISFVYGLYNDNLLIGVALFGTPAMPNVWKTYVDKRNDLVELRRFCLLPNLKKNTGSYFLSRCIKFLKKESNFKLLISYADPQVGHKGTLYKATNFTYLGQGKPSKIIRNLKTGDVYNERIIRNKNTKCEQALFAKKLSILLELGECVKETIPGKYIYTYKLQ